MEAVGPSSRCYQTVTRQRPTGPHGIHLGVWSIRAVTCLGRPQCRRSARSKGHNGFFVLPDLLDGPSPQRADARVKSLVKAIISLHIYHHLLFTTSGDAVLHLGGWRFRFPQ
jgi:hypothetical protein